MLDWIHDLPWEDMPPWIGAAVAVIVGTFTIRNVQTARRAYTEGAWDRQVATARLVWSEARQECRLREGEQIPLHELKFDDYSCWMTHQTIDTDPTTGREFATVNQDSVVVIVKVTNNSSEPVGNLTTSVFDHRGNELVGPPPQYSVVGPETSITTCYVSPVPYEGFGWSVMLPVIRYSDSAGHRWRRKGTEPPEVDNAPPKPRLSVVGRSSKTQKPETPVPPSSGREIKPPAEDQG